MGSSARDSTSRPDPSRASEHAAMARLGRLGGEGLIGELTTMYLADMPSRFAAMHDALGRHDASALGKAAHSMKSSSAQLGAEVLADACERVESAAGRRDFATAERWLRTVDVEYAGFAARLGTRGRGASRPDGTTPNDDGPVARRKIAVVEDNADNRLLVDAILGDRFELHEYTNGADALAGIRERRPDLVLLDVSLPGMDGVEVAARIRRDAALAHLPLVALTAHAMAGDRERYLAAGFDGYVSKPIVDERDLCETVESLLERARARAASAPMMGESA